MTSTHQLEGVTMRYRQVDWLLREAGHGEGLAAYLEAERAKGWPWRTIGENVAEIIGQEIAGETLRLWHTAQQDNAS